MPRIPKRNPARRAIHSVNFPDQMFMHRRNGGLVRANLDPEVWDLPYTPVQGPELPRKLEQRRQYLRDAQERYEAALAEEQARQAYNRRVNAWNSYRDLPPRERQFYPNRDDIARYLFDYEYIPDKLEAWKTTRDLQSLDSWSRKNWGEDYPMQDLDQYEGLTDLPPEFIKEPPWGMR